MELCNYRQSVIVIWNSIPQQHIDSRPGRQFRWITSEANQFWATTSIIMRVESVKAYIELSVYFSHSRIWDHARSLTALCIGTTVFISTSFGFQFFLRMASKNICSDGYIQYLFSEAVAVGIELTSRVVDKGIAWPGSGFRDKSVGIWFLDDGHNWEGSCSGTGLRWGIGHIEVDSCWCELPWGLLSTAPIDVESWCCCEVYTLNKFQYRLNSVLFPQAPFALRYIRLFYACRALHKALFARPSWLIFRQAQPPLTRSIKCSSSQYHNSI